MQMKMLGMIGRGRPICKQGRYLRLYNDLLRPMAQTLCFASTCNITRLLGQPDLPSILIVDLRKWLGPCPAPMGLSTGAAKRSTFHESFEQG